MSSITGYQQSYSKIAQFYRALESSRSNSTAVEKALLQIDNINFKIEGSTLLHIARYYDQIIAFSSLLQQGADFTAKNDKGLTALHYAFCHTSNQYPINWEIINGNLENEFVNLVLTSHVALDISENPGTADGLSHFHIACAHNHIEAVKLFLNNGMCVDEPVNVDSSIFPGYTPLHFAARFCGYETAKSLLEHGADIKVNDVKGLTPLHVVIERNFKLNELKHERASEKENLNRYVKENEKIIQLFLESNAIGDFDSVGLSKLQAACVLGDSSLAKRFLQDVDVNYAIDMNSPMWPGYTALHFAARFNIDTVRLLLENGANIGAKDAKGSNPFYICMEKLNLKDLHTTLSVLPAFKDIVFSDNNTKLIDFICATESFSTLAKFFQATPKDVFLPKNCLFWPGCYLSHLVVLFFIRKRDSQSLHMDLYQKKKDIVDLFGVDVLIQDSHGRTPLHLAFYLQRKNVIDPFFEHRLGILNIVDNDGLSHLHIACAKANVDVVRMLLFKGVNVNIVYKGKAISSGVNKGWTPLHIAAFKGYVKIVKMLLEHGADVNITDVYNMTPIHYVLTGCPPTVSKEIGGLLFSYCELKNIVSTKGTSHLHVASSIGNQGAVEGLLKLGADANAICICRHQLHDSVLVTNQLSPEVFKYTSLHLALINHCPIVVELLLKSGADIFCKESDGLTLFNDTLENCKKSTNWYQSYSVRDLAENFAAVLANDGALQKKMKDDYGITSLHVACALQRIDEIQSLVTDSPSDVNAQVHSDSPIWSGATPLHLLISFRNITMNFKELNDAMKPLLNGGADVTLVDNHGNSPIHSLLRNRVYFHYGIPKFSDSNLTLRLLVKRHKDVSLNPTNGEGISHFHLACSLSEFHIVEQYLKNGIDVNLPIDFRHNRMTFETPLHLVLQSRLNDHSDIESQLKTIDILLEYGADVNAQDENGSSPILKAARKGPSRVLFLEKLIKAGADTNHTNLRGESMLEILFNSIDCVTKEECSFFFNNRIHFNIFNQRSGHGIISMIHQSNYQKFLQTVMEFPSLFIVDQSGRTPIHNIVTNDQRDVSADTYANYVENFIKLGFDIDARDRTGKTAFNIATSFQNEEAVSALLIAGADINITDSKYQPDIIADLTSSCQLTEQALSSIQRKLALHIIILQICELEISSENLKLANSLPRDQNFTSHLQRVLNEIEMANQVIIGSGTLTLKHLLLGTDDSASEILMASKADRQAMDKSFESVDFESFPNIKGLIKMQYRKLMRLCLMRKVMES